MNWTRQQLKTNARLMVKGNYWLCVAVSFIVTLFAGGSSGGSSGISSGDTGSYGESIASQFGGSWSAYVMRFLPLFVGAIVLLVAASILFKIFVGNVLKVGGARFYLHNIHSKGEWSDLGFGFKNQYLNVVLDMFLTNLFIALWTLLLIVPGVIKALEYKLVPYLLAENPELTASEAQRISRDMMDGEKMNTFVLGLTFIGWDLLSAITLGLVGIFWVNPYKQATEAELFTAIKARYTGTNI